MNKAKNNSLRWLFLDLDLYTCISQDKRPKKIYDKKDDLAFPIVHFPFIDGDVPLAPSYGVYISHRVRYAVVLSDVSEFNEHNLCITHK